MKYIKKVDVTQLISNTGTIIDSMSSGDDQHTNAPSIDATKNYINIIVNTKHTWIGIGENINTTSSTTTTTVNVSIDNYSEFLLTVGNDGYANRALASTLIPKIIFPGVVADGKNQVIYDNGINIFGGGVSYDSSTNIMTIYAKANSSIRVFAR